MSVGVGDLGLAAAAGALTTLSPCVLPMIPLVVGGAVQAQRAAPLAIAAGMVVSFTVLGVLLGTLGGVLGLHASTLRVAGAWFLVVFGLVMLVPSWNARLAQWLTPVADSATRASSGVNASTLRGAFLLGLALGMIWTPCSGPLLGSTLTLVASEGGAFAGGLLLFVFGIGATIPLLVLAYASRAGFLAARERLMRYVGTIRVVFALLLILVGIGILTGLDKQLEAAILDRMPDAWIALTVRY